MQSPLSPVGGGRLVFHEVTIIFLSFDVRVCPFFCLGNLSPAETAVACKRPVLSHHVFLSTDAPPRVPTSTITAALTRLINKANSGERLRRSEERCFEAS